MGYTFNNYKLVSTDTVSDTVTKYTFEYDFIEKSTGEKFEGSKEVQVSSSTDVNYATAVFLSHVSNLGEVINNQLNSNLPVVGIIYPEVEEVVEETIVEDTTTITEVPVVEEVTTTAEPAIDSFSDEVSTTEVPVVENTSSTEETIVTENTTTVETTETVTDTTVENTPVVDTTTETTTVEDTTTSDSTPTDSTDTTSTDTTTEETNG